MTKRKVYKSFLNLTFMRMYKFGIGDRIEMPHGNANNGTAERGVVVGRRIVLFSEGYGFFKTFYKVRLNGVDNICEFTGIALEKIIKH